MSPELKDELNALIFMDYREVFLRQTRQQGKFGGVIQGRTSRPTRQDGTVRVVYATGEDYADCIHNLYLAAIKVRDEHIQTRDRTFRFEDGPFHP